MTKSKSQTIVQIRETSSVVSTRCPLITKSAYFDDEPVSFARGGLRRSLTQPLRHPDEDGDMISGGTIADRLAELQHSGNNEWKKRVPKNKPNDEILQLNIKTKNLYNVSRLFFRVSCHLLCKCVTESEQVCPTILYKEFVCFYSL